MPIEMPRGLAFSVDTWSPKSARKRHHFLTHAHKDHLAAIASHASFPIYCSPFTKSLVLHLFPQIEEAVFVEIEVGKTVVVHDQDGDFTVSVFDANHCPGAVMFLFEGEFGNILHTGDCRLSHDCLQNLPLKYIAKKRKENVCQLDYLFLDCTFGRCPLKIPSKQSAIQQIIKCIWKHPSAPTVYLAADLLGQEDILVEVCRTFGSKMYIDKNILPECFQALQLFAPNILSEDKSSRFQVIEGFPRLYERASIRLAEARAKMQPQPLFIRPSAQWYACEESQGSQPPEKPNLSEAIRDEFGIWHVCYSMHSSREELESSLRTLQPKWVISTTPPCRAMELDYVKKHCFKTKISSDDPLWKLLKVSSGKSVSSIAPTVSKVAVKTDTPIAVVSASVEGKQLLLEKAVVSLEVQVDSSLEEIPVTLFGRARLGPQEPYYAFRESKTSETIITHESSSMYYESEKSQSIMSSKTSCKLPELTKLESVPPAEGAEDVKPLLEDASSPKHVKDITVCDTRQMTCVLGDNYKDIDMYKWTKEEIRIQKDVSYCGSSKSYSVNLRKLYRSMNVPVPQPLPSLRELMKSSKRARVES